MAQSPEAGGAGSRRRPRRRAGAGGEPRSRRGAARRAGANTADAGTSEPSPSAAGDDDAEGARLIALNMALNGTPREETDRYLSENFQLADRDGLLDEVYASVEG